MSESATYLKTRLQAISKAALFLNSSLDLDTILRENLNYMIHVLDVDRGTIYLVDREKREIWSKIITGDGVKEIRLPFGKGLAGFVAESGEPLIIDDAYTDHRFNPENDIRSGYKTKTMMVLPMKNHSGVAIGVLQIINKKDGIFTPSDVEFATTLSSIAAVAIENAILYKHSLQAQAMKQELDIAKSIQDRLIPKSLPSTEFVSFFSRYQSYAEVGGDYLDVVKMSDGNLAIIIADVSGHGMPASLLVSTLQASFHAYLESNLPFSELPEKLNRVVYKNSTSETYITLIIAILNPFSGELTVCNAGHPSLLILSNDGSTKEIAASGPPMGMFSTWTYDIESVRLEAGDLAIFYTDGITETMNSDDDEFGVDGMCHIFKHHHHSPVVSILDHLWDGLEKFRGDEPIFDDMSILLAKKG